MKSKKTITYFKSMDLLFMLNQAPTRINDIAIDLYGDIADYNIDRVKSAIRSLVLAGWEITLKDRCATISKDDMILLEKVYRRHEKAIKAGEQPRITIQKDKLERMCKSI